MTWRSCLAVPCLMVAMVIAAQLSIDEPAFWRSFIYSLPAAALIYAFIILVLWDARR